jgi:hypothetical protein
MAFNGIGRFFLKAGESIAAEIYYGVGEDHGAQWIMAHAELSTGSFPQFGEGAFQVSNHRKIVDLSPSTGSFNIFYWCDVKNVGTFDTFFSMQGGGNT